MNSMTGFGRGSAQENGVSVTVELRSVNNRFFEASMRLPRVLADREAEIERLLRHRFDRGRVSVSVQVDAGAASALPLHVNEQAVQGYAALLRALADAAGIDEPLRLDHLLRFSEVFTAEPPDLSDDRVWNAVETALGEAMAEMEVMRRQEGGALLEDLKARLDLLETMTTRVEERAPVRVAEARARLEGRLAEILDEQRVDPMRIEQEIALLADKLDVTEECVRLRAHLRFFGEAMEEESSAGRRLNFLSQEIGREINTIGSKANDPEVAHLAVAMKEELERIREQVQNVE